MNKSDSITILMPVKNGSNFLSQSIQAIELNCGEFDEIIVIDDCSSDDTLQQLLQWQENNSKVRAKINTGSGLVDALNMGLRLASNNWIARFDVDDQYLENRVAEQRKWINSDTAVIFSDYIVVGEKGELLGNIASAIFPPAVSLSLITSSRTPHPGALLNRDIAVRVGGYRKQDFPAEDISLWLRMSQEGLLVAVPLPLLKYRVHRGSVTSLKSKAMNSKRQELISHLGISPNDLFSLQEGWKQIFEDYKYFSLTSTRRLLFFRDVALISKHYSKTLSLIKIRNKILLRLILNPSTLYLVLKMLFQRVRRRLQRRKN